MKIYKISATDGTIYFTRSIKADTYQDARNKFMLQENKNNNLFPYIAPDIKIESIFRRF